MKSSQSVGFFGAYGVYILYTQSVVFPINMQLGLNLQYILVADGPLFILPPFHNVSHSSIYECEKC